MKAEEIRCPKCKSGFATVQPSQEIGVLDNHDSTLTLGLCLNGHEIQVMTVRTPYGDTVDVRNIGSQFQ